MVQITKWGGKPLINGTSYKITGGKTKVAGTDYDIKFGCKIIITGTPSATYTTTYSGFTLSVVKDCQISINNGAYQNMTVGTMDVNPGDVIKVYNHYSVSSGYINESRQGIIYYNGTFVSEDSPGAVQTLAYQFTVTDNITIECVKGGYLSQPMYITQ